MTTEAIDFALLGHPADYDHLCDLLLRSQPDYGHERLRKHKSTVSKFLEWMPSYVSNAQLSVQLPDDRVLRGCLIICPLLPEHIGTPRQMLLGFKKTVQGCKLANEMGARIAGLGGFTSIVDGSQGARLRADLDMAITSGNSLTAALAVAQTEALLERLGWDLRKLDLAILGASGDIGRACTLALGPRARRVCLIARNPHKLQILREELPRGLDVTISTNVEDATKATVVIAATSASEPIIAEADLAAGTIVCDIGYPKTLSYSANPRSDVLIISGGLAQLPFELDIQYHTRLPRADLMYGCFTEALLLAMAGRCMSFSTGQGKITTDKMSEILALARAQDIRPAPLARGHGLLSDADLDTFLAAAHTAARAS